MNYRDDGRLQTPIVCAGANHPQVNTKVYNSLALRLWVLELTLTRACPLHAIYMECVDFTSIFMHFVKRVESYH